MAETFGRYQLLKRIAKGGMGELYLARQAGMEGFEKLLVIKRILSHLAEDEEFVHMFLDEARIAARLNHPNIAQIFDLGQEGTFFYIAMEYAHGEDLRRMQRHAKSLDRRIPVPLACRIAADAAAGLDFAHRKADEQGQPLHIVHRDVAPHNILVTFDGGVKLIDFGIARARGRLTHTQAGGLKGHFEYMSPEQAAAEEVDRRSDLFSLGVVLHEALTGARLFKRESEAATLVAVSMCEVPPPSSLNPDVPPELDAIVLKALARDAGDRFGDAGSFRLAIEDWLVQARASASSAHLAAYMHNLYSERLAVEAKLGHPVIEDTGTPSHSSVNANPRQSTLSTRQPAVSATASTEPGRPTFARTALVAGLAGGLAAVLAVALLLLFERRQIAPAPAPAPIADALPAAPRMPAPVVAPSPAAAVPIAPPPAEVPAGAPVPDMAPPSPPAVAAAPATAPAPTPMPAAAPAVAPGSAPPAVVPAAAPRPRPAPPVPAPQPALQIKTGR